MKKILALLLCVLILLPCLAACTAQEGNKEVEEMDMATFTGVEGTEWINAKKFGFVADGETPNDEVMKKYIENHPTTPLYFGEGVYAFKETIAFPSVVFLYLDPKAELRCIAEEPLEYFITLQAGFEEWGTYEQYAHQSFIKGGIINCDFNANTAIGVHGSFHTHFQDFQIQNVISCGVQTEINKLSNSTSYFTNILFYNSAGLEGTVAIYDNAYDNVFSKCTIINFETGIRATGSNSLFADTNCWYNSYGKNLIRKSVYADLKNGAFVFRHPIADTCRVGFRLASGASVAITDMKWITNVNFYSAELQENYPMTVFYAESDNCRITLNGFFLPQNDHIEFSNIPLPSSTFLNVGYSYWWDAPNLVKNFRNDTAILQQISDACGGDIGILSEMIEAYKAEKNGQ